VGEPGPGRLIAVLVGGQLGLHSAMAGLRLAAPLQLLREGWSPFSVGLLLALFAGAPVLTALRAGRLADQHGYHRPVRWAAFWCTLGVALALASTQVSGLPHFVLLCAAAAATGAAANLGMITIQRTAGLAARSATERVQIFSWLGVAPAFANVIGPVAAGVLIDQAGFDWTYAFLLALPLVTVATTRWVATQAAPGLAQAQDARLMALLQVPGFKRLLVVSWLLATSWDVHTFAVPILGHERGFSATVIGLILGTFTAVVTGVRMLIPWFASRLEEVLVIRMAMVGTAAVLLVYPLAHTPVLMALCAALLGVTLGAVQPMVMSLAPPHAGGPTRPGPGVSLHGHQWRQHGDACGLWRCGRRARRGRDVLGGGAGRGRRLGADAGPAAAPAARPAQRLRSGLRAGVRWCLRPPGWLVEVQAAPLRRALRSAPAVAGPPGRPAR
jgi:MFS family permease